MRAIVSRQSILAQKPPGRAPARSPGRPAHSVRSRETIQNHAYNVIGAASTLRCALLGRMRPDLSARELEKRRLVALAEITRSAQAIVALTDYEPAGGA